MDVKKDVMKNFKEGQSRTNQRQYHFLIEQLMVNNGHCARKGILVISELGAVSFSQFFESINQ